MKMAVRTHDFGRQSIENLPGLLKENGLDAAQLVLPKAFTEFDSYEEVNDTWIEKIRISFEKQQLPIHILGCYMDLGNPDDRVRNYAVKTFMQCLSYAKRLGAHMVGTETAYPKLTREQKRIWYPCMMDSLKRITEEADKQGVLVAIEPVYSHPLESLSVTEQVLRELSPQVKLIFDPANVLEFPAQVNQKEYWNTWLHSVGSRIEALHMKDFVGDGGHYQPVALGEGCMEYETIFAWLHQNKKNIVVIREELEPANCKKDLSYIKNLWKKSGEAED